MFQPLLVLRVLLIVITTLQSLSSMSVVQPAHAQWSYGGPAAGCTDVLDAFTGGVRNSLLSGSSKSITVQSSPSFQLRGPDCLVQGAFAITFDVASMRAVAVGAGARNVSIAIGPGVRFEVLVDSAAALSTWPLRFPTLQVLFAPSPTSPFDPNALPVDVSVTGVTWTIRDVVFTFSTFSSGNWFILTLTNGRHIPRGSRIAITENTTALLTGFHVNNTLSGVVFSVALVRIVNTLALLDSTEIIVENTSLVVNDTRLTSIGFQVFMLYSPSSASISLSGGNTSMRLYLTRCRVMLVRTTAAGSINLALVYSSSGSSLTLRNNSQLTIRDCTVSAEHTSVSYLQASLLYRYFNSPISLYDQSRVNMAEKNVVSVANCTTLTLYLSLVYSSSDCSLTLQQSSQWAIQGMPEVSAVDSQSDIHTYLCFFHFTTSSPVTLFDDSAVVIVNHAAGMHTNTSNALIAAVNTTSSNSLHMVLIFVTYSSPLTLHNASNITICSATVSATSGSSGAHNYLSLVRLTDQSPLTLRNTAQFLITGRSAVSVTDSQRGENNARLTLVDMDSANSNLTVADAAQLTIQGSSSVTVVNSRISLLVLGGLLFYTASFVLVGNNPRLAMDGVALRVEGVTATATTFQLLVFGSRSAPGSLTTGDSLMMDGNTSSTIRITNCSAIVRNVTSSYSLGSGIPVASIFSVPQTILRNHSTIRLCANTASVTNATVSGTYYPGAYTAAGAVGAAFGSVTPLEGCNSSTTSPPLCGLFVARSLRFCDRQPTRTVTGSKSDSMSRTTFAATTTPTSTLTATHSFSTTHSVRMTSPTNSATMVTPSSTAVLSATAGTETAAPRRSLSRNNQQNSSSHTAFHASPSAASPANTGSGTRFLTATVVSTGSHMPAQTWTPIPSPSGSHPPSTITSTTSHSATITSTRSDFVTRTNTPSLTRAAAATVSVPLFMTVSHDRRNSSSPSASATNASPTPSANSTPSHPLSRTISPGRAPEAPISAPLIPNVVETTAVALAGIVTATIAVDLQADTALAVSRCAVEAAGDAATVSGRSFRTLSPFATADSCDGLLQGHSILFGTAVVVMFVFVLSVCMWRRTHDEPTRPFHLVLSAAHCPSLLFITVNVFMLAGLVLCGGRTDGARHGLSLTVAVLLSAAGPVLSALLGTRRYVPYMVAPVPEAFRGSVVVCAAASVLLPRGELKPPLVRDTTSVVHVPAEWSKLLAAAVGAWRFPSPLLAFVPQLSALALVPAMLAHGALCAPLHWLSAGLFWASAVAVAAVRPRRILVADVLHCAALAVNGALVATAAVSVRGGPFAQCLSLVQTALTVVRVAHVLFVLLLPRIAPAWREALDESAVTDIEAAAANSTRDDDFAEDHEAYRHNDEERAPQKNTHGWVYLGWCHRSFRGPLARYLIGQEEGGSDVARLNRSMAARLAARLLSSSDTMRVTNFLLDRDDDEDDDLDASMSEMSLGGHEVDDEEIPDDVEEDGGREEDGAGEEYPREVDEDDDASTARSEPSVTHAARVVRGPLLPPEPSAPLSSTLLEENEKKKSSRPDQDKAVNHLTTLHGKRDRGLSRRRRVTLFTRKYVNQRPLDVVATLGINDPDWQRDVALERADREARERRNVNL